jgi:tetratricopeptide (TPR) repeat protein
MKVSARATKGSWAPGLVLLQIAGFGCLAAAQTPVAYIPDAQRCFSHDPDTAIAGCTAVIQAGRQSQEQMARAFSNRGSAYLRKRQYDRAIQDLDQAIKRDPTYAPAFQSRGTAYSLQGQNERAVGDFNQAIRLDPKSATSFYARGDAYEVQGQYDRAIQDFDQAIRLKPNLAPLFFAATYHERGLAYAGKGQYDRALQDYDKSIRLYPNLAQAFYDRGAALRALGQPARAEADLAKARQLNPSLTPPTDTVASAGAKDPGAKPAAPPAPREMTAGDLQKVTAGMSRSQVLQLGPPAGRITTDDDGHLIEIFQYSVNGESLGTVRLTDGTVSSVQIR